jgi:phage repressor protein C with HTH and peptisase S24 domain
VITGHDRAELMRDMITRTGHVHAICTGISMEPTITRGTRIRVGPCLRARVGDVVVIETDGTPITHRVLARLPFGILAHAGDTKGASLHFTREDRVIGRVEAPRRRIHAVLRLFSPLR